MRFVILTLIAVLSLPATALGADLSNAHTVQLLLENDFYFGEDRWNTGGLKLSWNLPPLDDVNGDSAPADDMAWLHFPVSKRPGFFRALTFSAGIEIFTPEDLDDSALIPDDRPYAGYTYLGVGINSASQRQLDHLELQLGVVGPASQAEEFQNAFHDDAADGWDNQLPNEFAFLFAWNRYLRAHQAGLGSLGFEVLPRFGLFGGTVAAGATGGLELRLGHRLPSSFATPTIRPAAAAAGTFAASDPRLSRSFGWYLFATGDVRGVGHNIFLDGGVLNDNTPSVDKEALVGEVSGGLGLTYKGAQLTFAPVWRSKEFEDQSEGQLFGTFTLGVTF